MRNADCGVKKTKQGEMMYKRVLIKVGTNLITDANGIRKSFLRNLVKQVSDLYKKGIEVLIVSSGAIGAGIKRMSLKRKSLSLPEKQAVAAVGQIILMQEYKQLFRENNIPVAQVLLDHDDVKNKVKNANARNTISKLLEWKVIPVINENDTVATDEIKFGDNDALAGIVGSLVNCGLVIILTDVDGVYDKNPRRYKEARFIERIDDENRNIIDEVKTRGKTELGRGGMLSKLEVAKNLSYIGIPVVIANGNKKDVLRRIIRGGKEGTFIKETKVMKIEATKRWILLSLKPRGQVRVDTGAKRALVEKGGSLLAVGVQNCSGDFAFGDAVDIIDANENVIGKGMVNYSSEDIKKIKGRKTSEIKKVMGDSFYEEVIHRDNLFIYK